VVDPARYRDEEEVRQGRADDPIQRFSDALNEADIIDDDWLKETAERVENEVAAAIDFANSSADPKIEDLFTYMYATPVDNMPGPEDALLAARIARGEE
jgi:pyruvate dehydrogenase E1 component alpha subunit